MRQDHKMVISIFWHNCLDGNLDKKMIIFLMIIIVATLSNMTCNGAYRALSILHAYTLIVIIYVYIHIYYRGYICITAVLKCCSCPGRIEHLIEFPQTSVTDTDTKLSWFENNDFHNTSTYFLLAVWYSLNTYMSAWFTSWNGNHIYR